MGRGVDLVVFEGRLIKYLGTHRARFFNSALDPPKIGKNGNGGDNGGGDNGGNNGGGNLPGDWSKDGMNVRRLVERLIECEARQRRLRHGKR